MKVKGVCLSILEATSNLRTMKTISEILPKQPSHFVGDAFLVSPVFAHKAFTNDISPFLMFDYGAPRQIEPSKTAKGVGEHPHRGFSTVTIAWQGESEHRDSSGATGVLRAGDVQFMHAGSGVVHAEYLSKGFTEKGGTLEVAQLWVNLPQQHKMTKPTYQHLTSESIPNVDINNERANVRVISGKFNDIEGPAQTFTSVNILEFSLMKAENLSIDIEDGFNSILFVRKGSINVKASNKILKPQQVAIMSKSGSTIEIETEEDSVFLLLSGQPLDEPIAHHGPFVMNTQSELEQAFKDYQSGKLVQN